MRRIPRPRHSGAANDPALEEDLGLMSGAISIAKNLGRYYNIEYQPQKPALPDGLPHITQ